ncbi:hypothetical protein [Streptosporangium longisporum]|uniref:Heme exporter protein D n=1 Tax=Streptosporangium longisporum TaxID=46187 RepID=A0ABP6KZA5_9ACTN
MADFLAGAGSVIVYGFAVVGVLVVGGAAVLSVQVLLERRRRIRRRRLLAAEMQQGYEEWLALRERRRR